MKKALLSLAFLAGVTSVSYAQIETKIGAHIAYGSEIENAGAGVNAEFGLTDKLSVAPSFTYFFPKSFGYLDQKMWEANANAHFYFMNAEAVGLYGLGGLNYANVTVDTDFFGESVSDSEGEIGFNIGAGSNFNLGGSITPFAELKYVISEYDQLVVAAGVRFNL